MWDPPPFSHAGCRSTISGQQVLTCWVPPAGKVSSVLLLSIVVSSHWARWRSWPGCPLPFYRITLHLDVRDPDRHEVTQGSEGSERQRVKRWAGSGETREKEEGRKHETGRQWVEPQQTPETNFSSLASFTISEEVKEKYSCYLR